MANSFSTWLYRIPSLFTKQKTCHPAAIEFDVASLIMDMAVTIDIDETLRQALTQWQIVTKETLNADLYIVSPSSTTASMRLLHANQLTPSPDLLQQLHYQLATQTKIPSTTSDQGTLSADGRVYFRKIIASACVPPIVISRHTQQEMASTEESHNALSAVWLMLTFEQAVSDKKHIRSSLQPLIRSLSQGWTVWRQHQAQLHRATASAHSSHANELHDTLAQTLGYLRLKSCQLAELCHDQKTRDMSEDIATQVKLAYRQSRDLISMSRLDLPPGTLIDALLQAIEESEQRSSIVFEVDNRVSRTTTTTDDIQVLYIVREALSNLIRHSQATHARLKILATTQQEITILVEDNGIGLQATPSKQGHFGLRIMEERANKIPATLSVLPRKEGGTQVKLTITGNKS
ncbi:ATP-binding protein [Marinomonas algarum]|uniref:histidine kinase n=1 Tax=Marinomonas algarum TaxID=2883105 RepID=A0A9X1IP86_9GAMM|nr:ATP-binding protein [Marinomonas algarum]MCB5162825.1 histidine kinase [Marinomonas algarum]